MFPFSASSPSCYAFLPFFLSIYSGSQQVWWKDVVHFWPLLHKKEKWDEQDTLLPFERKFYFFQKEA